MGNNEDMANLFGRTRSLDESRSVPTGDTVGSYTSYLDAQKAVDYLADQQFPVQLVSIVGNDLKMVERVTGRLTYPRVALSGALTGAWFGLFVGVLLSLFGPSANGEGYFSILTSILMGAAFWMLFGVFTYAMQRGKRDFTSTSQVLASGYDVIVAVEASQEARRLLAQLPMRNSAGPATAASARPAHAPQPQQPPVGAAPRRPQGWTDPYGEAAPEPAPAQEPAVQGAVPVPAGRTPGTFPDLPDGRPQYGVRVRPEAGQEPEAGNGGGSHAGTEAVPAGTVPTGTVPVGTTDEQRPAPRQGAHPAGQDDREP
ncbi:MAG: hypothetical protein JWO93_2161 [Micrococcaceae bacterium]|nr:hypothetical protein [Micrococcaceae bacterium]